MNRFTKFFLRTILWIVGVVIAFVLLLIFLIRLPSIQNYVVGKVTEYVEHKIGTTVKIGYVNIEIPKKIVLEDIYFEDQSKDTLLAGEKLKVDIDMFQLLKSTIKIQEIDFEGITAKINRDTTGDFNFDYIIKAFVTEDKKETTTSSTPLIFDIDKVNLDRIYFVYTDDMIGTAATISLKHFDTRIKTFDLEKNMSFNLPNIAIDGLTAIVKQWAPSTASQAIQQSNFGITDSTASTLLPNLATENIDLKNILVKYQETTSGIDTKFDIKNLSATVEEIDLNKEIVRLNEVKLDQSDSYVVINKTSKIEKNKEPATAVNWIVSANKIQIDKTNLLYKDNNEARMKGFDYFNIGIKDLAGTLDQLYYASDSISGSLKNLTAKDHSGFYLKRIKGDFVYTNKGATINGLLAETPNTVIRDYIAISYPSLDAITKYPNLLKIDANIVKSHVDMRDILYFAPFLDQMDVMRPLLTNKFYIDGKVKGNLNDLNILALNFRTLDNTEILASANIKGLPDVDKMQIDLTLKKLITGRKDLDRLVDRSLLPEGMEIQYPNSISLTGNFKGGLKGFDTNLKLVTEKGDASVNGYLNMAGKDTTYDATVSIQNFNLGHFIKQDTVLGFISAEAKVKGTGLNPKTMVAEVAGNINRLEALGYNYNSINLDLNAQKGAIDGKVNSLDPNIKFDVDMAADMTAHYPKVYFNVNIDSVNLQNLNLMKDNLRYHGKIKGNFQTADLNHLNGEIIISESSIAYNKERYALDSISLIASADTNRNTIVLKSELINAHLVGKFMLTELSNAVQDVAKIYYNPNNDPPSIVKYENQNFEFSATLTSSKFIKDFFPDLEKMDNISLDGTFNSGQKSIMAKLIAPEVIYSGIHIKDVGVDIITVDSTMYYSALINKIKINNIELNNTTLSGQVIENNLDIGLWIKDKEQKDKYHLGGKVAIHQNNYVFSLFENGLMLNYDKWDISPENQLSFGKDGIRANDFRLSKNDQVLLIQSTDSTLNAPIQMSFNNFRIETLSNMLESETFNLGGGINGEATISRLASSPVLVSDIDIDKVYFGKDTIGDICIKVNNLKEDTYTADISISENGNDVRLVGDYYAPTTGASNINATLTLNPLKIKTIEAFSMGYLKDSEGDLNGKLSITGNLEKPNITGDLTFNKANINIAMLNANLLIDNQKINFNEKGINFKQFALTDLKGNQAKLNGNILTSTYTDFNFNLNLTTYNFAVVNSTRADNDLFYGKLYVTSNLRIKGDLDKPIIDGNVKANENTDFVFIVPNENPGIAERDGVVKFVNKSEIDQPNVFAKLDSLTTVTKLTGFDLALNLSTAREAKFKVILNEGSQDALNIQGIAELNTAIDASEKITMSGTFTVEDGNYSFNFGPIKKEFGFQKGSTITWNGDPLDARLDITALYSRRFSPLELVSNQIGPENQNLYRQKIPFNVKLILTGELFKPDIRFDIDVDDNNSIVSQDVISKVENALTALRNDPAEMNKQVFSLIVLGNFMSANPFGSLSGSGGVESFARNSVSSFLSNQLNNLASDLIKGIDLDFNLQSEQDYLSGAAQARTDLNVNVSKMLFDDRLKITIGSNFEVEGQSRPGENPNNIAGDISIEYQLSADGRYFIRAYRKNEYQATLQGQFVETGIGFIVNISYDKFREIFMSEKALETYYNTESNSFRKRFNVERMDTDSIYRDSVRLVIRDSLMKHSPQYRKRVLEREKQEQLKKDQDTVPSSGNTIQKINSTTAIRNEEDERKQNEK
ncbi:translocation/assembly module TamB domain-containing protein [Sphingobacterium rhinopitheci]|uniref:translocation/assembly module TamB domain-containing protein n=1 Tax=Sphingobacterium rhinopitheci TaxID=2781960 RepID=UPI001F524C0F|nr:translocation/assembly module TamB [Sphingobacterium rhinopitheci]MCI0920114.1 translocation/assembly module TamB [Sphingobacterium rhinopitheci]